MKFEEHMDFLESYEQANVLAIDDEYDKDEGALTEDFFKHVYADFTEEDVKAVESAVYRANSIMLIKAALGGGKSTLLHAALRSADPSTKYFLFDFKHHIDGFYGMGGSNREKEFFIHEKFKEHLADLFLPDLETKIAFVFDALRICFKNALHYRILKFRDQYNKPHLDANSKELKDLFRESSNAVADDLKMVMEKLTCAQMIRVIVESQKIPKFLLIIDNVDRFPTVDQPILFGVAIDIHSAGRGKFGTIIAVRNKNLAAFERAGFGGNIVEIVSLTTKLSTRPHSLTEPSPEFSRRLLEKRQAYAVMLAERQRSVTATRSAEIFAQLKPSINNSFVEERLYNLANHSYRKMLELHTGLVGYLFRLFAHEAIPTQDGKVVLPYWEMVSYLYRWLYATTSSNHEFLLDIVGRYSDYRRRRVLLPIACDIELVELAWLVNNRKPITKVGELVRAFSTMIQDSQAVYEGLQRLYATNVFYRHIELGTSEEQIGMDEIRKPDTRLQLNPLGREFVESTVTKFEFLHQCLMYPMAEDEDSTDMMLPAHAGMDSKVERVLKFLMQMKDVHAETLKQVRDSWEQKSCDWELHYRSMFCINEDLILERIARSHLIFLKKHFPKGYPSWREQYWNLIAEYHAAIGSSAKIESKLHGL